MTMRLLWANHKTLQIQQSKTADTVRNLETTHSAQHLSAQVQILAQNQGVNNQSTRLSQAVWVTRQNSLSKSHWVGLSISQMFDSNLFNNRIHPPRVNHVHRVTALIRGTIKQILRVNYQRMPNIKGVRRRKHLHLHPKLRLQSNRVHNKVKTQPLTERQKALWPMRIRLNKCNGVVHKKLILQAMTNKETPKARVNSLRLRRSSYQKVLSILVLKAPTSRPHTGLEQITEKQAKFQIC